MPHTQEFLLAIPFIMTLIVTEFSCWVTDPITGSQWSSVLVFLLEVSFVWHSDKSFSLCLWSNTYSFFLITCFIDVNVNPDLIRTFLGMALIFIFE